MSPAARTSRIERNLRLYPVVQAIVFTPVMLPIIVLFWEDNGLDMLEVFVLQGLFAVAMAVAEVPTGMVADRLGKKTSLTAGVLIVLVGMFVYGLGHGFAAFLAAEVLLALGIALLSGADSSLLYDSLDALGRTAEYTRREGRARSVQMVSFAASNLLGGVIGSYDYRAAVWASMIGPAIALFVVLQLTEVQPVQRTTGFSEAWRGYRSLVGQTLKFVRKHALVRWYIVLLAVMGMGQTWLLWLYQPYMAHVELPVWSFGIAFAGFNLFAAFASHRAAAAADGGVRAPRRRVLDPRAPGGARAGEGDPQRTGASLHVSGQALDGAVGVVAGGPSVVRDLRAGHGVGGSAVRVADDSVGPGSSGRGPVRGAERGLPPH